MSKYLKNFFEKMRAGVINPQPFVPPLIMETTLSANLSAQFADDVDQYYIDGGVYQFLILD